MCGRNDGPMRWAMEAIAAGVGGPDLATWTLAREDERAAAEGERRRVVREHLFSAGAGRLPDDAA